MISAKLNIFKGLGNGTRPTKSHGFVAPGVWERMCGVELAILVAIAAGIFAVIGLSEQIS